MRLVVNGEDRELPHELSVAQLLEFLEVRRELVAVEVNREVVPRSRHESIRLRDGDRVEIVSFTGGG